MSDQSATARPQATDVFDALGHPMRRRMLVLLREGPRPVGELAAELPIKRPAVSKHLRVLEGAGLVEHRSRGTRNLYVVAPAGLQQAQRWLTEVWDVALSAFADFVDSVDSVDFVEAAAADRPPQAQGDRHG
jgi:DNA-binding transcriptional ArsR family regulator